MKKIIAAAAGLMMAGTLATSAFAVESQFGGYFHALGGTIIDIDGTDSGSLTYTTTRTRLYYTAVFNENLKFVNKFEIDYFYGDDTIGDIGADGKGQFEIKNSYIDFNKNNVRFKIGTQYAEVARGFLFANDFSGIYAGAGVGDNVLLQAVWIKVNEDEDLLTTPKAGDDETDLYAFIPVITLSDALQVTPYIHYANVEGSDADVWFVGTDVDFSTDAFSVWGTAIYNGGEMANQDDIKAWLLAAGGNVGMFHGQVFYATGDDDAADGDEENFAAVAPGQSYVWAEILGEGDMWEASALTTGPVTNPSNIFAANVGVKTKISDKLTIGSDLWYAMYAEDVLVNGSFEDDLGVEVDVKLTYMIQDNLKLDLIGAYLFADDAYNGGDEDPIEVGARISLSF